MRLLLLLIAGIALCGSLKAQLPKRIKYDVLVFSKDSSLVMIDYKQRQALYDIKKKKYKEEAGKSTFVYLPEVDCFFGTPATKGKIKLYEPDNTAVNRKGAGFLLEHYSKSAEGEKTDFSYSFVTFEATVLFAHQAPGDILKEPHLWMACVEDMVADTLFEAPYGKFHHRLYKSPAFYVSGKTKMGIICPGIQEGRLALQWSAKPEEFVHYNPDLDFEFWLEDDSIYFKSGDQYGVVSQKKGKISYWKNRNKPGANVRFEPDLSEGIETSVKNSRLPEDTFNLASIEIKNGCLIVNDASTVTHEEYTMESENASVWKNIHGRWTKISPYYASVLPIPGGFIAKTGMYRQTGPSDTVDIPSRYFLLDTNCLAVAYLDYFDFPLIEDLGFGLKVCLDHGGCFFMTYDRVAVTDAEWDDFELFNGKLQAILHEKPMLDEKGNQVYDANGVPQKISESVTTFFKIP